MGWRSAFFCRIPSIVTLLMEPDGIGTILSSREMVRQTYKTCQHINTLSCRILPCRPRIFAFERQKESICLSRRQVATHMRDY